jgi:putative DNA primase/helicase
MSRKAKVAEQTDLGNSERFVRDHAGVVRFVGSWSKWLTWTGARWALDVVGGAEQLGKETVRKMLAEAGNEHAAAVAAAERSLDDAELLDLAKERQRRAHSGLEWALESHGHPRIRSMVQLARSAPELAVTHADLDADPWALNCANGTVDLRTGKLRPHDPSDLITKLAPVDFHADAPCPTWDAFLARTMGGDPDLVEFLRRMVGYALTGVIREHVLGFLFGGGANGKSTFLNTMHAMLGDYAVRAPRGLLFRARGGDRHETELTTLFGARFVSCAEVDEGAVFDEALVKDLTGGDPITARRMREDHWTFTPTHKLFLAGNHKPQVRGADEGIWRRIRLVPWTVTIPTAERDGSLPEKLRAELPGILAWAVRGCLEWQRDGLGDPGAVLAATDAYRAESDPLREFFVLHCVFAPDDRVPRKQIRGAYEDYCKENGAEPLGAKRFAAGLKQRGVRDTTVRHGGKVLDGWAGVRLATEQERDDLSRRVVGTSQVTTPIISVYARAHAYPGKPEVGPCSPLRPTGESEPPAESSVAAPGSEGDGSFSSWLAEKGVA